MIKFKETGDKLDIEYTKGDTFEFNLTSTDYIPEGSCMRLQISLDGYTDDVIIEKSIPVKDNTFVVLLDEQHTDLLKIHRVYQYRFTFYDVSGRKITTISGNLIIKWGA